MQFKYFTMALQTLVDSTSLVIAVPGYQLVAVAGTILECDDGVPLLPARCLLLSSRPVSASCCTVPCDAK
jgi:hypothetical protein